MAFSLFFSGKISVKRIPFGLVKNTFYSRSCTYMDITITIIDSVPKEIDQPNIGYILVLIKYESMTCEASVAQSNSGNRSWFLLEEGL